MLPYHHVPTQHNEEEAFGVEYLYKQAGRRLELSEDSTPIEEGFDNDDMDEGFVDESTSAPSMSEHVLTVGTGAPEEEEEEEEDEEEDEVCNNTHI